MKELVSLGFKGFKGVTQRFAFFFLRYISFVAKPSLGHTQLVKLFRK
ncbi:hypothetical protein BC792_11141 [Sphingobacterium allocomposti]|uniref:Uncharacterized protein n=1 Tax=Sphingobacterium allocomposti TaxID=415956 RepID=A0A5S5DEZ8_9SPHI|nr:hypothetical protein BC792_11141 [Sphingobacterium composti Yoo et al. 2007 non Ten et al. 2007]